MKLLIIAGPYEADRIRRAAVPAGFEAVAVEPGESLSGWITATRPDVIILAPRIVSVDVNTALDKVRSVPRGRVPIFLVGDADEQEHLENQADGFFVRPVVTEHLFARAREAVAHALPRPGDDAGSGPLVGLGSGPHTKVGHVAADDLGRVRSIASSEGTLSRTPTLRPLVAARRADTPVAAPVTPEVPDPTAPPGVPPPPRKTSERWPPPTPFPSAPWARREPKLFAALADDIEADFDAEIREVVRAVTVMRAAKATAESTLSKSQPRAEDEGLVELKDESSQKTLEVPSSISAALIETERSPGESRPDENQVHDGGSEIASSRDRVLALHGLVMDANYFRILGVGDNASAAQIQEASAALMKELSPATIHPRVAAELEPELIDIRATVTEAARLLMNDTVRERYQRHVSSPRRPSGDTEAAATTPTSVSGEGVVP